MTVAESLWKQLESPTLSRNEGARLRCRIAAEFEDKGQYDAARDALAELWPGVGQRPALDALTAHTAAEVLLRAGVLSGWFGNKQQLEGAQAAAKDLLSESITRFQALGEIGRAAIAQSELALCYRFEGALDEARVLYTEALRGLSGAEHDEDRAKVFLRLTIIESLSSRYHDVFHMLTEAAPLFEASSNHFLKGRFHNELGCALVLLGKAERRPDYTDRAILEYTAAAYHFGQMGNTDSRGMAENNLGHLFYVVGRYAQAHEHLDCARRLLADGRNKFRLAQGNETRARVLLAEGRIREAAKVIHGAVRVFSEGGEQGLLAEALTTQGVVFARSGDVSRSQAVLRQAADTGEAAGAIADAGRALLTLFEEHAEYLTEPELIEIYQRADDLLRETQDIEAVARLRACAKRLISVGHSTATAKNRGSSVADFWANFSLTDRVQAFEARYIRRALSEAEGSVSTAARLLGFPHHASLASLLKRRHQGLAHLRTPPETRRRSLFRTRVRSPRQSPECRIPKAAHPIRLLHVEDNKMVARLIKEALEAQGFSVETCHDGAIALKKIQGEAHYDVLLFDNELPGVQGLELIRRAREFAHRQHTPMLMLSASPYEVEALRAGADAFLLKPSDANSLLGVINRLLAHRLLGMPEIETARLRLRLFTANDLDDLTHLFGDPDVMRYLGVEAGQTHSRAETQPILDSIIGGWRRRGFGRWAVIHKESGQLIGVCGLRRLDGEIELVYMLAKEYWGRGYAREAARANLRFGFEELGLKRIVAITRRENVASQHVMQSIGMRYEREGRYYGVEAMCYAISRAEFAAGDAFYALTRLTPDPS